ncbi:MAG: hypothetical protein QMD66_00510 [Actinomycetota bacterium]|nr:hypothetical protein [Actinomycetota bacterium]
MGSSDIVLRVVAWKFSLTRKVVDGKRKRTDEFLQEARRLIQNGFYASAYIRPVTAFEFFAREAILRPYFQERLFQNAPDLADFFLEQIFGRGPRMTGKFRELVQRLWNIDPQKFKGWSDFENKIIPTRNRIMHRGEKVTAEDANYCISIVENLLDQIEEELKRKLPE